jgi:hypothetical protein
MTWWVRVTFKSGDFMVIKVFRMVVPQQDPNAYSLTFYWRPPGGNRTHGYPDAWNPAWVDRDGSLWCDCSQEGFDQRHNVLFLFHFFSDSAGASEPNKDGRGGLLPVGARVTPAGPITWVLGSSPADSATSDDSVVPVSDGSDQGDASSDQDSW